MNLFGILLFQILATTMIRGHDVVAATMQLTMSIVHRHLLDNVTEKNSFDRVGLDDDDGDDGTATVAYHSDIANITNSSGDINNSSNTTSHGGNSTNTNTPAGDSAYEFVAFLMWYIFLVLCCIVPTCLAYRRRRLMEARLQQQQEAMSQLHHSNMIILNNLHQQQANQQNHRLLQGNTHEEEAVIAARSAMIAKELQKTTMTVTDKDLLQQPLPHETALAAASEPTLTSSSELLHPWQRGKVFSMHKTKDPVLASLSSKEEDNFDTAVPTTADVVNAGVTAAVDTNGTLAHGAKKEPVTMDPDAVATLELANELDTGRVEERDNIVAVPIVSPLFHDEEAYDNIDICGLEDSGYLFLQLPVAETPSEKRMNEFNVTDEAVTEKTEIAILPATSSSSSTESVRTTQSPLLDVSNANRTVPGTCIICLSNYVAGEKVSWSSNPSCSHAFHTDCITPWLSKRVDQHFNCPVCRQEFCSLASDDLQQLAQQQQALTAAAGPVPSFRHVVFGFTSSYPDLRQHTYNNNMIQPVSPSSARTTTTTVRTLSAPNVWTSP